MKIYHVADHDRGRKEAIVAGVPEVRDSQCTPEKLLRTPAANRVLLFLLALVVIPRSHAQTMIPSAAEKEKSQRGILLERLNWDDAERVLTPDQVVVIALGAEAKEHGRHLPLNNDWLMAEYFKNRVLAKAPVVVAPTINYSYYPAFLEYPGSTSLRAEVARDMVIDIVRSFAHHGPKRFYVLNTGISTLKPLAQAASELAQEGILLRYTDFTQEDPTEKKLRKSGGTHADEIETSMMLYIAPDVVHMDRAVRDLNRDQPGPLTRDPKGKGTYSPTGAWGDPTLATREEGQAIAEAQVTRILEEIEALRRASVTPTRVRD